MTKLSKSHKLFFILLFFIGPLFLLTLPKLYSATPSIVSVSVGNEPRGGAYNPSTYKGVVSNHNTNTVTIINATNFSTTTVTVGSHPYGVAINNSTNKAYIANEQSDTVSVITLSNNTMTATIPVGNSPRGIAVNSSANVAVVANSKSDTVSILNLSNNSVTATVAVGTDPEGVVINAANNSAYVTNFGSNTVSVINLTNNTVSATIPVGSGPLGIDINTATSKIMVANHFSNTVSVIAPSTNTVTATINVGLAPYGVAINSTTSKAYISNEYSDSVSVIDMGTNTITATYAVGQNPEGIAVVSSLSLLFVVNDKGNQVYVVNLTNPPTGTPAAVGKDPEGVVIDPDTNTAITANSKSNNLSVIDLSSGTVTTTIPAGQGPQDVAIHPTSKRLVSANYRDNTATIIDYPTRTVIATVTVGNRPRSVAIDPVLNIAVVANEKDGTLSLIDLSTNTVSATISAGTHPADIAINPTTHIAVVANKKTDLVTLIDLGNKTTITTISVGKDPVSVAINPDTNIAVVANQKANSVSVINLFTKTVIATLSGIVTPTGVDINPSTNIAAVVSHENNSLVLIDLSTNLITSTINSIGADPEEVAINPNTNLAVVTNETSVGVNLIQLPNPVPVLTSLSPVSVSAGGSGFTLTLNGSKFIQTSTVTFNNQTMTAQFVSNAQLTATIPASAIINTGTVQISVTNPAPGGGTSNSLSFTINNPVPLISSITPGSTLAGTPDLKLTINGSQFLTTSIVSFNGTLLIPVFVSTSQLMVTVPAANVAAGGSYSLMVINPAPGGGASNGISFTVNNPVPTLTALSPSASTAGSGSLLVTVTGTNFVTTSTINYSGQILTPQFVNTTQMNVTLPASAIATAGLFPMTVTNPTPGGGVSNSLTFAVNNPVPQETFLTPNAVTAGSPDFTLQVAGINFVSSSIITFNGLNLTPQFVNSSQMNVTIPASAVTTAGIYTVTITNPAPGGGVSNGLTFTANNPVPALSALSTMTVLPGSSPFLLTLTGMNFVSTTMITVDGVSLTPSFITSTQLSVTIPASLVSTAHTAQVSVFNPAPGGGVSNTLGMIINTPPVAKAGNNLSATAGKEVTLDGRRSLDTDGDIITFRWSLLSAPLGNTTSLINSTSVRPRLTPDLAGSYQLQLIVNDGKVDSLPAGVTVTAYAINSPPNADAGADQTALTGQLITLDGRKSSDPGNDKITYQWSIASAPVGSTAILTDAGSVQPALTPDLAGTYQLQLIVNDGTANSLPATVNVMVAATTAAPIAKAGRDQNALTGTLVSLNGAGSRDPNGNPLTYRWSFVAIPAGSTAGLTGGTTATPGFTPDISGEYLLRLVVNNGTSDSAPDTVLIVADTPNPGPNASAGADQLIYQTDTVTLDGSASSDPNGDPITYQWLLVSTPAGSQALLSNTTVSNPTFVADLDGDYVVRLTVSDGVNSSFVDVVVVKTKALVSIALNPVNPAITLGQTLAFTATGMFIDNTTRNLTNLVSWSSTNTAVATMNTTGTATALQAGTTQITASYGTIASPAQTLSVNNPLPVLSSLTPSSAIAGSSSFTLILSGSNFINTSTINFGSQPLNTTFVDASHLSATVPASAIASPGTVLVSVLNPAPGGGTSNSITFNIIGPVISAISPASGPIGTVLTITGQNFDPLPSNNQVRVNNTPAIITSASITQIKTLVPEGATTGPVYVTTPQGSATSPTIFTVNLSTDFGLTGVPATASAVKGSPATFVVTSASIGSIPYTGLISLTTGALPAGVTVLFTPPQITPGGQSILTVNTPSTLLTGAYPISISGTAQIDGQIVTHQSTVTLQALATGTTTLYGQVISTEGIPLPGVTVTLGASVSYTDGAGNFFLQNIPTGAQMVAIDGRTANTPGNFYPQVDVAVTVNPGASNPLGYPLYLPKLDIMHPINLPVDVTGTTTTVVNATTPLIPDLVVTIPLGTKIIDPNGNPVSQITITPVPIDKSPMPLPAGVNAAQLFTIQPGGSVPSQPIPICFPNLTNAPPGTIATIYYFDIVSGAWKSWGVGTATTDGRQICSNAGYGLPRFAWHTVGGPPPAGGPPPSGGPPPGGDPVDVTKGQLMVNKTDMVVPGLMPISLNRSYLSANTASGPFGIGTMNPYAWYLIGDSRSYLTLVTGDGRTANFHNTGVYPSSTTFVNTTEPWLSGAVLNGFFTNGWTLKMKDGTTYTFADYYHGDGNVIGIADRYGNKITLTYQSSSSQTPGQITQITDASGRSITLTYDANNHAIQATDPIGRTVHYSYDSTGHLLTVTDPAGGITTYGYDTNGRMNTITDARGILYLTNQYDANGRVVQQTLADGGVWHFAYQTNGSIVTQTTVTDPSGSVVVHRMNGAGYQLGQTDPLGQVTNYNRTMGTNQLQSKTDPLGRTTSYTYDANSNVTSITDPAGNITRYTYEPVFNKVTSITDPLGNITRFSYDAAGNLISTTDPSGGVTQMTYNSKGQPTRVTDPLGNVTQFSYDSNGNLMTTTDPLGNQTSRTYDAVSRLIQQTDPMNHTTSYAYDPLNRVTQITDALNGLTKFTYDPNGNLFSLTDANNHTTTNSYDNMDHLATRTDALLRQESYQYDSNGSLTSFTDRNGQITRYQYDALQRRILTTYGDGSTSAMSYDDAGRLATINDSASGMIQYGYDTLNRMVQETTPQGVVNYGYDALGRRTSMTANGQAPVSYGYDANSRLTTLMALSQVYSLTYDPAGKRKALSYPNGVTTSYSYDADSRVLNILHQAGVTTVENIGYSYDQIGNRTAITRANGSATNLPQALQAAYDAANQQTQVNSGTPNLIYDANGNLTNDGTNTYTWNARNQLISISGNVTATFSYDAVGRRTSKTFNGNRTDYQYDGNDIVAEIGGGAVGATYVRSLNIDEPFARITSGTTEYFHTDALGSVFTLTDANGNTTTTYTYDPFGNTTQTGISANPFQYTGREQDNTGLLFYRARYYSPTFQRFISEDPIRLNGGDINFYSYVSNLPLNLNDPIGLWGFGGELSATANTGIGVAGVAITSSVGRGVFWGGEQGVNTGGFESSGAFAGGPGYGPSYPSDNSHNVTLGSFAGAGAGAFFTNANSAADLTKTNYTASYDIGIPGVPVLAFGIQFSWGNGFWVASFTSGPGAGIGRTVLATNTTELGKRK